jgi:uncharacterized damage-inducible protein DinB
VNPSEAQRLAEFSSAVRQSTLKRLSQVPSGKENWRPSSASMTFADIAHHIAEADSWLFRKLEDPTLSKMAGKAGEAAAVTPEEFQELVTELRQSGQRRAKYLSTLTDSFLDTPMFDDRFGDVTVWWVIVRGNLDHEAHHRGQLAVYLRIIQGFA